MQTILWWQQQLPLRRPIPFLDSNLSNGSPTPLSQEPVPKLTKLLVNVTIQGTFRAIKLVMSTENTVADLVAAVLSKYVKDCRLPILPTTDPSTFDLHFSQFCFERLGREKKLIELESRNFFLCRRKADDDGGSDVKALSSTTCSAEIGNASRNTRIPWLTFMDILM
ncbi:hypothetical protein ACOSP7_001838 [Xanthoceras sorbifolium]|uniref:DUF7054 domain-containing protein n=1 Tax=Xanthoceras sorbifolium TaxID=99658 RepID=A0ABQ8H6P0_9ROSI|nr:hypothetical protein JRO89_XS13G0051600 [Xanthoceras sorbifolium]